MKSENNDKIKVLQPLALSVMLALGMVFGYKMNDKDESSLISFTDVQAANVGQIEELIRFIETKYVDSIDRDFLVRTAIESILDELDPHTIYISPDHLQEISDEMEGKFKGIGIEVYYIDDTVNIIKTVPGGPASNVGIMPYDKLITINDSLVAGNGLEYDQIRNMLRGDFGEHLDLLLITKEGKEKRVELDIDDIPVSSVEEGVMVDAKTGYIKVNRFGAHTYKEFMAELEDLIEKDGMEDVIIDLRDNSGGYLPQATNILSQLFKEKDKLLVYTKGNNDRKFEYKTTGKTFFDIGKISVLINENSASASEIVAGAIQDWDRGVIVGRRSFGKGLVQEQYDLSNEGALRLTVARYYTPSGRSIQRSYDDMEGYYNDLDARSIHGELYTKDSMVVDSGQVYKTIDLKRPVYGGGGIAPDIFIAQDSQYYESQFRLIVSPISQFVFKHLKKHSYDDNQFDAFANTITDEYMATAEKEHGKAITIKYQNEIYKEVATSMYRFCKNPVEQLKHKLSDDDFVKASLQYFNSENKLTDLLLIKS